ncbi:Octanoyltransferase [compost metagenome]
MTGHASNPRFCVVDLGTRDYQEVWTLQKRLVELRADDQIPDVLLYVEHPHVITLGRKSKAEQEFVVRGRAPVYEIERGGEATYHGPGQLVGYPIFKLQEGERDLHRFLRNQEEALIRAIAPYGLVGDRNPGYTGVWCQDKKLASIGVAVRRWVTYHGFGLNVSTDLSYFGLINPCGLSAEIMSSVEVLAGRPVPMSEIKDAIAAEFESIFARRLERATLEDVLNEPIPEGQAP